MPIRKRSPKGSVRYANTAPIRNSDDDVSTNGRA